MRNIFVLFFLLQLTLQGFSQTPQTYNAAELLVQLKKLKVLGSVLYIAAHPDDENNTLLPYLANEQLYRTAYLSLTRGDGGQNLIGDEQGIDLGLIRTQELLAARKIDGSEQYFSRAYEFGFSKSAEEALRIWDKEKILADVVWVIRKYQPDVIIKRFPGDTRAGHGHHAASAILADEAFVAAADPAKFPEQFKYGVKPWQAKRLLWNTYNFGSNNTTSESQLKIDIGGYNPILGKSYGEIGAAARSMHKSQGEGRPGRRGQSFEYFVTTAGDAPVASLMDGIDISWSRVAGANDIDLAIDQLIKNFRPDQPVLSVPALTALYEKIDKLPESNWRNKKRDEVQALIENCGGIFMEVTAQNQLNVIGDSARFTISFNNRTGIALDNVTVSLMGNNYPIDNFKKNENTVKNAVTVISKETPASQPYWLEKSIRDGAYQVDDQTDIGNPEPKGYLAVFTIRIGNTDYHFQKRILYKYTDPVKGELYQPIQVVYPVFINSSPSVVIFTNDGKNQKKNIQFTVQSNKDIQEKIIFKTSYDGREMIAFDSTVNYAKGSTRTIQVTINGDSVKNNSSNLAGASLIAPSLYEHQFYSLKKISYDHIPDLYYNYYDQVRVLKMDLKTRGKLIGYITGAGDKVPQALEAMGYEVRLLSEQDITDENLKKFDAVITGIRAYNIYAYLTDKNEILKRYVSNGGNLIVQYLKSNFVAQKKIVAGPYPFTIESGSRVTEEDAPVQFLMPQHPVLNFPNKISQKDFEGWVQERSTYQVVKADEHFEMPLAMNDTGEKQSNGSLAIAQYGKGNFVYAGLVFFRQLPAGVPGAYRLMANLIALPKNNK